MRGFSNDLDDGHSDGEHNVLPSGDDTSDDENPGPEP